MPPRLRAIFDLSPESRMDEAVRNLEAADLHEFLKNIDDREFFKHQARLKPIAEATLKQKEFQHGRAEFKKSHWWARWEVWVGLVGVALAVVAIIQALKK